MHNIAYIYSSAPSRELVLFSIRENQRNLQMIHLPFLLRVFVPSCEPILPLRVSASPRDSFSLQQGKLDQLKQKKKALMQQLLTGKVSVKV